MILCQANKKGSKFARLLHNGLLRFGQLILKPPWNFKKLAQKSPGSFFVGPQKRGRKLIWTNQPTPGTPWWESCRRVATYPRWYKYRDHVGIPTQKGRVPVTGAWRSLCVEGITVDYFLRGVQGESKSSKKAPLKEVGWKWWKQSQLKRSKMAVFSSGTNFYSDWKLFLLAQIESVEARMKKKTTLQWSNLDVFNFLAYSDPGGFRPKSGTNTTARYPPMYPTFSFLDTSRGNNQDGLLGTFSMSFGFLTTTRWRLHQLPMVAEQRKLENRHEGQIVLVYCRCEGGRCFIRLIFGWWSKAWIGAHWVVLKDIVIFCVCRLYLYIYILYIPLVS